MTIRISPSVARFAGVLLYALVAGAARGGQDYEFRHENVLGTSLELCVRADTEHAARSAEAAALAEIDRLALVFSGYDAASEFCRWQTTIGDRRRSQRSCSSCFVPVIDGVSRARASSTPACRR